MTEPHYADDCVTLYNGDCLEVLRSDVLGYDHRLGYAAPLIPDNSIDAVVTDPPYGLGFMGKEWDDLPPGLPFAQECLRVLKPGGHMLAFGGTRTWHRLAVAVEDAGFEMRDSIAWLYGSGFPKSLNVAKAIESGTGRPEDIRRLSMGEDYTPSGRGRVNYDHGGGSAMNGATVDVELSDDARAWEGWGTALKPAFEPVVVARKPLAGTVAANVLAHGTGALNIDGCRVGTEARPVMVRTQTTVAASSMSGASTGATSSGDLTSVGRWPANVVLDEAQAAELDAQSGTLTSGANPTRRGSDKFRDAYGDFKGQEECVAARGADSGGASRFFYIAKAAQRERVRLNGVAHPTVKPLALMQWLVRLVTPPDGVVLEPFAGSGTTVEACLVEGFRCVAIEREVEYLPLILKRCDRSSDTLPGMGSL